MHHYKLASLCPLLIAALTCAATVPQSTSRKTRISRDVDHNLVSDPLQTIGDYFDGLSLGDQSTLSERTVHHTQALTEVIATDGATNFNISMSRCVTMAEIAGIYTARIGNIPNATVQDIVNDLQIREGSEAANRVEYSSRVQENAELAIIAANDFLAATVADYTPITTTDLSHTHGELRHLLTAAQMIVLIIRSSLTTEILVSVAAGVIGRTFGGRDDLGAGICALVTYALQMSIGILDIVTERPVDFVSATIYNIFLSWVRDSMRVYAKEYLPAGTPGWLPSVAYDKLVNGKGTNHTADGPFTDGASWPLMQDVVKVVKGALGLPDQPLIRFKATPQIDPGNTCPARGPL